jgi:hypothetical protein
MGFKLQPNSISVALRAGAAYFAIVFSIGFMLGIIRVLWVLPQFGERTAELMEAPFMLVTIVAAARWIGHRFSIASRSATSLGVGIFALSLLVSVEFTLVLKLRGLSISEYAQSRDPIAGTVYLVLLIVFASMPAVLGHQRLNQPDGKG